MLFLRRRMYRTGHREWSSVRTRLPIPPTYTVAAAPRPGRPVPQKSPCTLQSIHVRPSREPSPWNGEQLCAVCAPMSSLSSDRCAAYWAMAGLHQHARALRQEPRPVYEASQRGQPERRFDKIHSRGTNHIRPSTHILQMLVPDPSVSAMAPEGQAPASFSSASFAWYAVFKSLQ